ncbi:MAG: DUF3465 domain-containing protein [Desulfobacteraceae bacterium]|nr:DUF3465 domain-containing protein [Desulfobacteraceae bacterium]
MKKLFLLILFCFAVYGFINSPFFSPIKSYIPVNSFQSIKLFFTTADSSSDQALEKIFQNKQSDIQVGGSGKVVKLLPGDTQGSQHQKFIIKLKSGQTLLIAHNIDIAPRIDSIKVGDHINFYGEYKWNSKGGVVHWTHHDPKGRHKDGWLSHGGKMYK